MSQYLENVVKMHNFNIITQSSEKVRGQISCMSHKLRNHHKDSNKCETSKEQQ